MAHHLTAGWTTFGQPCSQGFSSTGLKLGSLTTQTDIKTLWSDDSIRFAIVTASIPSEADYALTAAAVESGTITPTVPSVDVTLTIGGTDYVASVSAATADLWLNGPLVKEFRAVATPTAAGPVAHGFLRVYFDIRVYNDDDARVDVTVENCHDVVGATSVVYDVDISINAESVFSQAAVTHYWLTRWRKTFTVNLTESAITLDHTQAFAAKALIPYLSLITNVDVAPTGTDFGILKQGSLHIPMSDVGGRPEIAPFPNWAARFIAYQTATQRAYVLAHGDLAGSWAMHIRESDETLVSIDLRPHFWLDSRADGGTSHPRGDMTARGTLIAEFNHQPSLAFVPYIVTGDRYYCDEMKFWANWCLLDTWDSATNVKIRNGAEGLLRPRQTRGIGWAIRNISDCVAYMPDADATDKAYFNDKLINNLDYLDTWAASPVRYTTGETNTVWMPFMSTRRDIAPNIRIALWEHLYLAWAIDRAASHGFAGGTTYRDMIAEFQTLLFSSSPDFNPLYAAPYELRIGTFSGVVDTIYTTIADVFNYSYTVPAKPPTQFAGYYGPETRLVLLIAIANEVVGAQAAYDYLYPYIGVNIFVNGVSDLAQRAGWALDPLAETPPEPPASPPSITAGSATVRAGGTIGVTFADITNSSETDRIGLFREGEPATAEDELAMRMLEWFYTNGTKTPPVSGSASGSLNFVIPGKLRSGGYEFRYLEAANTIAVSAAFTVQGKKIRIRL